MRKGTITVPFNVRTIEMLESPAYRVLSLSAHRVLDRICIELRNHGGNDNGRLPVTYDEFEDYGMDRDAIAPAIRELEALGFIEVTQKGKPSAGKIRWPNFFRLTFIFPDPTDEWKRVTSMEGAKLVAKMARQTKPRPRRKRRVLLEAVAS
jgi:hypothetical protein